MPCRQALKRSLERRRSSHQKRWTDPAGGPGIGEIDQWKIFVTKGSFEIIKFPFEKYLASFFFAT